MNRAALMTASSVVLLFVMGLLMVFNTTSAEIIDRSLGTSTHWAFFKQLIYGVVGCVLGTLCHRWGYHAFLRWSGPLLGVAIVLLLCTFVPGLGQTINGARRWIGVGGLTFQPSECVKLIVPAYYIRWVLLENTKISFPLFLTMLMSVSLPIGLICIEPDNGSTAILLSLLLVLFFLTKLPLTYWAIPLSCLIVAGGIAAYQMPHARDRIRVYLHPELDLRGKGHQPHQAKIAAGSGRFWGRGIGESLQKLNYLPEAHSDYIAAIYAEETGFVGMVGMIALYMMIACGGCLIALRAVDQEGFLLAAVLTFLISIQAFLNLGVVSALLPSKGMTLPFISQGGSSLVMHFVAVALLLSVAAAEGEELL